MPIGGSRSAVASVTTTTVESASRAARAEASANASVRSPGSSVDCTPAMAASAVERSRVSEARTWAESSAATTVTRPPSGSRPTTVRAAARAASIRGPAASVAPIEADVSMTSTTLAASSERTVANGRAAAITHEQRR